MAYQDKHKKKLKRNILFFNKPQSIQEADMLEYLRSISPTERTQLLGALYADRETRLKEQMLIVGKVR